MGHLEAIALLLSLKEVTTKRVCFMLHFVRSLRMTFFEKQVRGEKLISVMGVKVSPLR